LKASDESLSDQLSKCPSNTSTIIEENTKMKFNQYTEVNIQKEKQGK
jgi:hypothetical protein